MISENGGLADLKKGKDRVTVLKNKELFGRDSLVYALS